MIPLDPFRIDSPTCISFSGGRTSAYMLWLVLQANGGFPSEAICCFANTGKEEPETLDFVHQCATRWSVPIRWLEYRRAYPHWAEVTYETASRHGEPFEQVIDERQMLPNPFVRFCTSELKVRAMHRLLKSLGWDEWDQFIGIRADEHPRVAKIRARGRSTEIACETMCLPLADAGVTVADVMAFWEAQPFNLELAAYNGRTYAGNCDLCYLKPLRMVASLIADKPERAVWWAKMEALKLGSKQSGQVFRIDRPPYAKLAAFNASQRDMFDPDEQAIGCYCGE